MGSFSIWHWLVVLVIVMLVFGTKKLRNIGQDLGGAVKGFKEGIREANTEADTDAEKQKLANEKTIDAEVHEKSDKVKS